MKQIWSKSLFFGETLNCLEGIDCANCIAYHAHVGVSRFMCILYSMPCILSSPPNFPVTVLEALKAFGDVLLPGRGSPCHLPRKNALRVDLASLEDRF